ncbi:MAG TPA: hypothetical protein VFR03_01495, partial [Thermoanaerobaculia bacterium]|nr:hypothetical protein [Thermoanaerobaculia bacterium]
MGFELIQSIGDAADQSSLFGQQENGAGADDPEASGDRNRAPALLVDQEIGIPFLRESDGFRLPALSQGLLDLLELGR